MKKHFNYSNNLGHSQVDSNDDFKSKRQKYINNKYITYPFRGYLSQKAQDAVYRLQKQGFDPDLAYALAESWIREDEFYEFPDDDEETEQ